MGLCCSENEKKELNLQNKEFLIKNEANIKKGKNLTLNQSNLLNEKVKKSVCEIIIDNGYGSGFFCKIKLPNNNNEEIYCLITNNHVITKNILMDKDIIEIKLNNKELIISLNKNRRIWTNEKIDFVCFEIIKEDNIIEIINPIEIDENCYNINYNTKEYDEKGIVIPGTTEKDIELPQGIIGFIKDEKHKELFFHNCNTKPGFSGGPIILIDNLKIIGIHRGYEENNEKNIGIYFKEILRNINKENEINRKNINYILDIGLNEVYGKDIINCILEVDIIGSEIIIFNQNENNKKEIKDNYAFLGNKRINIINEENKWKIYYKFTQKGKYNLKIIFKNNIKDMNSFFENCSNIYSIDLSNFDTSKVNDMGFMFSKCHKLQEIKGINKFNTNQVTKMNSMFKYIKS